MTVFGAILVFTSFLISGKDARPQGAALLPVWRTDLRPTVGSAPLPFVYLTSAGEAQTPGVVSSLWFSNDDTVVATFVVGETKGKPQLSRRGNFDNTPPLRLRAIFLDASTGKITNAASWPTESRASRIIAAREGKMVTWGGSDLALYAPNLTLLKRLTLPPIGLALWSARASPTGKNILLDSAKMSKGSWIWVETDSLKIVSSWVDEPSGYRTISDQLIATSTCWSGYECRLRVPTLNGGSSCKETGPKCEPQVRIRGLSTEWKTIAPGEPHTYPQFINEDMLFLFLPGSNSGRLISTDGKLLFEEPKGIRSGGCWGIGGLPSADGRRFVIPSCQVKGANPMFDIGGHIVLKQIVVYDVGPEIRPCVLDVKGPNIQNHMDFALSPDGSKLAVLSDEFVEVFRLPPPH